MSDSPMNPVDSSKLSDRELLLILHERVGTLSRDMHDLKDGTERRIIALETRVEHLQADKLDALLYNTNMKELSVGNEQRTKQLQRLNQYVWFVFGALAVLQIGLTLLLRFGWPH